MSPTISTWRNFEKEGINYTLFIPDSYLAKIAFPRLYLVYWLFFPIQICINYPMQQKMKEN